MSNNKLRKKNTINLFRLSKNYNWDLPCDKTYQAIVNQFKNKLSNEKNKFI